MQLKALDDTLKMLDDKKHNTRKYQTITEKLKAMNYPLKKPANGSNTQIIKMMNGPKNELTDNELGTTRLIRKSEVETQKSKELKTMGHSLKKLNQDIQEIKKQIGNINSRLHTYDHRGIDLNSLIENF